MKQQPANDGPEYTRWSLKWEELTRTIGDWGDAWTHRKVTTLAQFVGWLADAIEFVPHTRRLIQDGSDIPHASRTEAVRWACLKADEFHILDRPPIPITDITSMEAVSYYDRLLIAARKKAEADAQQFQSSFGAIRSRSRRSSEAASERRRAERAAETNQNRQLIQRTPTL